MSNRGSAIDLSEGAARASAAVATLHRAEPELEEVIRALPVGIFFVDAELRIRTVNPVALRWLGCLPGGIVGRDFAEVAHVLWETPYADEVCRVFRRTLEVGEPYVAAECAELRIDRRATEHFERRLNRVQLPDGTCGVVCYFRDISAEVLARRAIETNDAALTEAGRHKDEFLATLSHELRNPLAPLRTGVELLEQAGDNALVVKRVREMMGRQLTHLGRLVDDLRDVSRISRGRVELQLATLDLRTVVEAALELSKASIVERRHNLAVHLGTTPLPVHGDFDRLVQVVGNLLSNAAKYTEPGGSIRVSAETTASEVRLSVRDDGFGIPPERLEMLFEMFTQLPEHRARTGGGGLGIGLALSRQLAALHGGTIVAKSGGLGCGSEFVVHLPLAAAVDRASPAHAPARGTTPQAYAKPVPQRVLVVDDNVDASEALRVLLELEGHTVEVTNDGPSALVAAEWFVPEVVLLDIGLPGIDGYEVARRLRARRSGNGLLLCAMTGWGQPADKQRAYAAGFDLHLTKPLSLQMLRGVLVERNRREHAGGGSASG